MSLVVCGFCKMNTLVVDGKCQHCGNPFKLSIWKRKLRRREAYGVLIFAIGLASTPVVKGIGVLVMFLGAGLIAYGFFRTRVRY